MKLSSPVQAIVAGILMLLLFVAVPVAFAKAGGRGGGGAGRSGGRHTHVQRSPSSLHSFRDHRSHAPSHHHRSHSNHFFFGLGVNAFAPGRWWYDPYYYSGPSPYYTYYGYPYSSYYGYPGYWSDPCLSSDPAYTPYCPPTADNPYDPSYSVPPVDYSSPALPTSPESSYELGPPTPPQQPTSPVDN
ncbi:hypothetical protein [Candidatus Methylomirabilis sp.]|uniref:hypothetical protein n=1 Tax=Candidatus Methylomirabilis sp. TaxID=2032687 RepID=UPI003075EF69